MGDQLVSSLSGSLWWRRVRLLWVVPMLVVAAGCGLGEGRFDRQNARAHVERLAGTIGSRPAGSPANERARAYLIETLQLHGFEVRVQEADAQWTEAGYTARVANIIAIRNGQSRDAIALVAHYDSVVDGPGAGDDAFGVAASLEAARVLATRASPRYSLMVIFTDAEEDGLLGARALVQDAEVRARLKTFINVEAIGVSGPVPLFETGPGTGPALRAWAAAPHPRGGSYMPAIYKALPNDTDATVLRELGAFGLNFAAVGNSHAYHTDRERPDRVSPATLATIGDNLISIVEQLDTGPLEGSSDEPVYFSVLDRRAFVLSTTAARAIALVAVLLGLASFVGLLRHSLRTFGVTPVLVTYAWATLATSAVAGTLWASVWLLRTARAELHPWHASPWRLFAFMTIMVVAITWGVRRFAAVMPIRLRPLGTPGAVWLAALPVWTAATIASVVYAVGASYLVSIPLALTGLLLPLGFARPGIARAASAVSAAVVWALWALDAWALLYFAVAALARVPLVTPTWLFPALFMFFGVFLWPPVLAVLVGRPSLRLRHGVAGSVLATLAVISAGLVLLAPAYTADQPQRRSAMHVDDRVAGRAFWRLGSNEPGVDIGTGPANVTWTPVPVPADDPWRTQDAFVFEGEVPAPTDAPPARLSSRLVRRADGADLEVHVGPHDLPRLTVAFVVPEPVVPTFSSLPGRTHHGRWQARYVNVPREGLTWRASVPASQADALANIDVRMMRPELPGSEAPVHVPNWLSRERTAWRTVAVTVVGISPDESEVPPDSVLGESRFAPTPLGRVHYLDRGTGGSALVFLHGWGGHAELWRDQLPLAAGQRALFVDLPGHGRSDVGDGPYSVAGLAEALHVTLQSAGVTRAVVVGHSLGALVGWHLALRAQDRVEALVSVDGTLLPFVRTADEVPGLAGSINPADMRPFIETLAPNLFTAASPPPLRDRVLAQMQRTPPHVLAQLMKELLVVAGPPFAPGTLTRPVLALEATVPQAPSSSEGLLRALFPVLDYRAFPNAGHYLMIEQPREVNDAIAGFLLGRGLLR